MAVPTSPPTARPIWRFLESTPLYWLPRFCVRFVERWVMDACPLMAAALAFFGILSLFPLLLAAVSILAHTLSNNTAEQGDLARFAGSFFPGMASTGVRQDINQAIHALAHSPDTAAVSKVALVSLLWSGRLYFDTLAYVLNQIWPDSRPRVWWQHQMTLWGLMFGTGALFLLSSAMSFCLSLFQSMAAESPELFVNHSPLLWYWLGKLSTWLLTFLMFYLLYDYGPRRQRHSGRAVVASVAMVATFDWESAKWLFGHSLRSLAHYQALYGSVAGLIVTMIWIYVSSLIILIGAECAAAYEDVKNERLATQATSEMVSEVLVAPRKKAAAGP